MNSGTGLLSMVMMTGHKTIDKWCNETSSAATTTTQRQQHLLTDRHTQKKRAHNKCEQSKKLSKRFGMENSQNVLAKMGDRLEPRVRKKNSTKSEETHINVIVAWNWIDFLRSNRTLDWCMTLNLCVYALWDLCSKFMPFDSFVLH